MSRRGAGRRVAPEQWRALLVVVEAAVALQPETATVIGRCLYSGRSRGSELAQQVTRLTSGYAYLISRVDELRPSLVTDEVGRLLRYHHMLLAETARYAYNSANPLPNERWRYVGDLGHPAARLRDLRELVAGMAEQAAQ